GDQEAGQDEGPLGTPPGEALGPQRRGQQPGGGGGEDHPGLDGVIAPHDLQVGRAHERGAHEQQPLGVLGDQAKVGGPVAEQPRRQQRLLAGALLGPYPSEEPGQDQGARNDQGEHQPAVVVGGQDPHDDQDQADGRQDGPAGVEGTGGIGRERSMDPPGQPDDHRDDQGLEDEGGPPADRGGQPATDQRPRGPADAAGRADLPEGAGPGGQVGDQQGGEDVDGRDQQGRAHP